METKDFTTSILVDQSPEKVFKAVTNVRGWWSEDIEGSTANLNDVFNYHYKDIHRCRIKLIEVIPDKKIVWLVEDNYFNFTKDKEEWTGNKIIFDIEKKGDKTQLVFTQQGLTPMYECYVVCRDNWTDYVTGSLRDLIEKGKGKPNPKDQEGEINKKVMEKNKQYFKNNLNTNNMKDFQLIFKVNATPQHTFESINNISRWWTEGFEGSANKLNDEFTVRFFDDLHVSTQRIIEFIPGKKIVWQVISSNLNFLEDKQEWNDTNIVFELTPVGNQTQVTFTHLGLTPEVECYKNCHAGWTHYLQGSLMNLINTGKGKPTLKNEKLPA